MTQLDDAGITTGTVGNLHCDRAKELLDGLLVLKIAEDNTTAIGGVVLCTGDKRLNVLLQCLGLCEGRSDSLCRIREIAMLASMALR